MPRSIAVEIAKKSWSRRRRWIMTNRGNETGLTGRSMARLISPRRARLWCSRPASMMFRNLRAAAGQESSPERQPARMLCSASRRDCNSVHWAAAMPRQIPAICERCRVRVRDVRRPPGGTYARLKGLGIEPLWVVDHGVGTAIYYEDPDGNIVEINVNNYVLSVSLAPPTKNEFRTTSVQ